MNFKDIIGFDSDADETSALIRVISQPDTISDPNQKTDEFSAIDAELKENVNNLLNNFLDIYKTHPVVLNQIISKYPFMSMAILRNSGWNITPKFRELVMSLLEIKDDPATYGEKTKKMFVESAVYHNAVIKAVAHSTFQYLMTQEGMDNQYQWGFDYLDPKNELLFHAIIYADGTGSIGDYITRTHFVTTSADAEQHVQNFINSYQNQVSRYHFVADGNSHHVFYNPFGDTDKMTSYSDNQIRQLVDDASGENGQGGYSGYSPSDPDLTFE